MSLANPPAADRLRVGDLFYWEPHSHLDGVRLIFVWTGLADSREVGRNFIERKIRQMSSSLIRHGRPITFDDCYSLPHGPVLGHTLNLVNEGGLPLVSAHWLRFISPPANYNVHLVGNEIPDDLLSREDMLIIEEIFEKYGSYDPWPLVRLLHEILPEWTDPGESSRPISYESILAHAGVDPVDILAISKELGHLATVEVAAMTA